MKTYIDMEAINIQASRTLRVDLKTFKIYILFYLSRANSPEKSFKR